MLGDYFDGAPIFENSGLTEIIGFHGLSMGYFFSFIAFGGQWADNWLLFSSGVFGFRWAFSGLSSGVFGFQHQCQILQKISITNSLLLKDNRPSSPIPYYAKRAPIVRLL